ncbi:MAG: hypothetical protein ACREU5_12645, partial [Burkholderiales bacterium]
IAPSDGEYAAAQGHRYAALASASKNYSLAQIEDYLNAHGWSVTYAWEQGTPTRGQFAVDTWLASLPADTTDNHRWIYAEANRTGPDASLGADPPWPLTLYHLAHVFEAVPGAAVPTLPMSSSSSPSSRTGAVVRAGAVAGALGLVVFLGGRFL